MAAAHFSRQNLDFTLYEVLKAEELCANAWFNAHNRETFSFTLDAATDIAEKILIPAYSEADRNEPQLKDGKVNVHESVHRYFKAFAASGLLSATFPEEWGGQQLPKTVAAAAQSILGGASNSHVMFGDLVKGVCNLLLQFGSEEQKSTLLPKLASGEWAATMCLTETQAGSSLSDVATSAVPLDSQTFSIRGQKVFISAGEQDITENIVHLVLGRIQGAPAGVKGISLFIVPKKRWAGAGLADNDVKPIGIYHKMGQKATPAMHLEFGGQGNCIGYLVGEANKGLQYMFQMMNGARLEVGLAGVYTAISAYHASLQYAKVRVQGRRAEAKDPNTPPVPIIEHPDVRRMLLAQKAFTEGTLAFILQCYLYLDLEKVSDQANKTRYRSLLELLTPVAKAYGSDGGNVSVSNALQVLGGYGYTIDFPLEQLYRDARIYPVYEGTNGIQAIALLGRQVLLNNGEGPTLWLEEVGKDLENAFSAELQPYASKFQDAIDNWQEVTGELLKMKEEKGSEVFVADANLYMELFALINVAWQWLRMAKVAENSLRNHSLSNDQRLFYQSKLTTMKFYFDYELVKCVGLGRQLKNENKLTLFDKDYEVLM